MSWFYSEIFPYLVIVVGVENILVITKSVVSTPVDLEVKIRVAQGTCISNLPQAKYSLSNNKVIHVLELTMLYPLCLSHSSILHDISTRTPN